MTDPVENEPESFTRDDVNNAATRAAAEAERRAARAADEATAAKLGVSVDEAAAIIAAYKASEEAAASDLDRARAAQAAAEATAAEALARAEATEARAAATTALLAAKLDPGYINDALRLIDQAAADIDAEIAALAERMPALFAPIAAGAPQPPVGHTPPKPPTGTGGGKTALDRAKALFEANHPSRNAA